jgi:thiosulfate/3-mercaptopyruvate sulfurtransferase
MPTYPLISADDAKSLIGQKNVIIFDASSHLPNADRNAEDEFIAGHLPGAMRFDINTIALPDAEFPHTMPTAPLFQRHMQLKSVSKDSHVLIYDDSAIFTSARAWFMFRYFGHDKVQIIDGGLKAWKAAGGDVEAGEEITKARGDFIAQDPFQNEGLLSVHAMKKLVSHDLDQRNRTILDARSADRFYGRAPEPRQGLASGHMPGAVNIPFTDLLNRETGLMKPIDDLKSVFKDVDPSKGIVTSCGSGVTACALILGLNLIGRHDVALYDGSWTEWGSREDCPISV